MKLRRLDVILTLILLTGTFAGCDGRGENPSQTPGPNSSNTNSTGTTVTNTNAEELAMLINIPYETEESVWRDYVSQKKIIAVLRFSTADSDKLVADSAKFRQPEETSMQSESWFPDELIAQGDMSGDVTLKGTTYAANAFYQDAFQQGKLTRINDTNYFVLEMSAK